MKKINVNSLDRSIVFRLHFRLNLITKVTNRPTVVFIIFSKLYYVLNCFVLSNKQNVSRKAKLN